MSIKYLVFYFLITASSFASFNEQLSHVIDNHINDLVINTGVEAVENYEVVKEEIISLYSKYSYNKISPR
ncbi:MAG: hypothetical protein ACI9SK_002326 [Zhongshania sp.]|jgi:hypothetical protein